MRIAARCTHLVVLLWIVLLSALIWHRASVSEQLPISDAFEYYAKAKHFWDAVYSSQPSTAFDVEPTFRPVGTVLMSYPFGFNEDPRPFYFRSVFFGVVALFIAVFVAATSSARRAHSGNWATCVAMSASVLPMFYHFEAAAIFPPPPVFWGLVDGFFAGVAAFAAAAAVRAVVRQSIAWTLVAVLAAAYSLVVKPTGMLVMAIIGLAWFTGVALVWFNTKDSGVRKKTLTVLGTGSFFFAVVFGSVLWWCTHSQYLSATNIAFGSNAMAALQADWKNVLTFDTLKTSLYPSFGLFFPLALLLPPCSLVFGRRSQGVFWRAYGWHVAAAAITLFAGSWLWLSTSNATQVRYFFPFALAGLIFSIPPLQYSFSVAVPTIRKIVIALLVVPIVGMIFLLLIPSTPSKLEQWLGVHLASGHASLDDKAAAQLLEDIRIGHKVGATIYDLSIGSVTARIFASHAQYERLVHPNEKSFDFMSAGDWIPSSAVRTREIVESDYILVKPFSDPVQRLLFLSTAEVDDFQSEIKIFQAWASDLGLDDGVATLSTAPSYVLYRVVDRDKLELSLARFRNAHKWRAAFLNQNPAYWWSREKLDAELLKGPVALQNVNFSSLYRIEAVEIRRADGVMTVDVWWSGPLNIDAFTPGRMFLHIQDSQNRVVQMAGSWLHARKPAVESAPIRLSSFRFSVPPNEVMSIALGIYDAKNKFLLADAGKRDWGNQRVLMRVPE